MKTSSMLIFLSIVLTVHILVNLYIFIRGWQALEYVPKIKPYYIAVFILFFLSYIVARISERYGHNPVADFFMWLGSFWFAAMLYFFLFILLIDIFRLFNHWLHFFPSGWYVDYPKTKFIALLTVSGVVVSLIIYGFINASIVRITQLNIEINKKTEKLDSLHIVMLSDIHLGTLIGKKRLDNIVEKINAIRPDIVLLAGDVVDENIKPVIKNNLGVYFENLHSKYGVYAITGNHEFIGGVNSAVDYLEKHGVKFLRDSVICIDNSFYLAGRNDKDMKRFTGMERKTLAELFNGLEKEKPLILLDHQPFYLETAAGAGVDLQLSGHTHNGQLFPLNLITRAIYNPDWGYRKINRSHFYVSCGVGTWGPPVRIGNRPEIVNIMIRFRTHAAE